MLLAHNEVLVSHGRVHLVLNIVDSSSSLPPSLSSLVFLVAHLVHRSFAPTKFEFDSSRTPVFGGSVSQQELVHMVRLELETSLKRHQAAYHLS